MQVFKFKVYVKSDKSCYREIEILSTQTFKDFHHILMRAFDLKLIKAIKFFICDSKWKKQSTIPLSNPSNTPFIVTMSDAILKDFLPSGKEKLIYQFDNVEVCIFKGEIFEIQEEPETNKAYPNWANPSGKHYKRKKMKKDNPFIDAMDDYMHYAGMVGNSGGFLKEEKGVRGKMPSSLRS